MNEIDLSGLLKDYIKESKEDKTRFNKCLSDLKTRMIKIEALCDSGKDIRVTCFAQQADIETRMRLVEKSLSQIEYLPKKFEVLSKDFKTLTKQVYLSAGAMTIIIVIAGFILKGSGS